MGMNETAERESLRGGSFGRGRKMLWLWENPQPQYKKVVKETLDLEEGRISVRASSPENTEAGRGSHVSWRRRKGAVEAHEGWESISEDGRDEDHGWKHPKETEPGLTIFLCCLFLAYQCWLALGAGCIAGSSPGFQNTGLTSWN